ncbi:MAG: WD40/YVTN/BNR-like repeat-containing protein, partial [Flavobacteriales bacterium]
MKLIKLSLVTILIFSFSGMSAQKAPAGNSLNEASTYSFLSFRGIGPAITSGRISDIAVNPKNKAQWYVTAASGGVWKTDNAGTTFTPVFDEQGSFSIGCVSLDPSNPNVVWVGTGENNNQRSVCYGDGVYKSEDGGKTWKNVGLSKSEHIGNIVIDPTNSNIVYVAAYGPLWSAGGERGVYKTVDGGKTWKQIHNVSEHTGCNEVHMDPRNPKILYAAFHQRRRHQWTYIGGGPESALYRSTDAGETWNKVVTGFATGDIGRIGLAISPVNPDVVYAIVEAKEKATGFYKSTDRGVSWNKMSGHATSGNYYMEIFAHPTEINTVFSVDTWAQKTLDGGKTFIPVGERYKHVDNHVFYIDPAQPEHMLLGCDGGLYETWDGAANWEFKANLPVTQFYKVSVDNAKPFYNVYGGTQDNNSLGGPSRTVSANGITNADWFITVGGDGFETVIDPVDPNILYSQWQYGGLIRYDRKTGEALDIKPKEQEGDAAYRWNWDSPLIISAHSNTRLYFACNRVFRTDDRGNNWKAISPDLTRQEDRNKWPVMGKVWSMDAVAKNKSTTIYGNVTAISESRINHDLIYAGTDDGLIQVTTNGGANWIKTDKFSGVPDRVLVQGVYASKHNENVVYATFNNHRNGDFKPYLMKSADKGKTWASISSNLPQRGSTYCMAEDHKNPNLLFVGTEFGVYFTLNGGTSWMKLGGGLPTICVHDME